MICSSLARAIRQQLLAFAPDPAVRTVISEALGRDATLADIRVLLLEIVAATPPEDRPAAWAAAVARGLSDPI